MSSKHIIPNLLTGCRIIITIILGIQVAFATDFAKNMPVILMLIALIYLSDFLDGHLARKWGCFTQIGATMDIVADLFYIVSQCLLLIMRSLMSPIVLLLILSEFVVFMVTSNMHPQPTAKNKIWFDKIGKMTAVYYYFMPLLYLLLSFQGLSGLVVIANLLCFILTIAATLSRLRNFIKGIYFAFKLDRVS